MRWTSSVCITYCKKSPFIWPILSGNGNTIFHENCMFKRKKNVDRYTVRDNYSTISILLNLLVFIAHYVRFKNQQFLLTFGYGAFLLMYQWSKENIYSMYSILFYSILSKNRYVFTLPLLFNSPNIVLICSDRSW